MCCHYTTSIGLAKKFIQTFLPAQYIPLVLIITKSCHHHHDYLHHQIFSSLQLVAKYFIHHKETWTWVLLDSLPLIPFYLWISILWIFLPSQLNGPSWAIIFTTHLPHPLAPGSTVLAKSQLLINPKYPPLSIPVLLSTVNLGKVNQNFLAVDTMNLSFSTSVQSSG